MKKYLKHIGVALLLGMGIGAVLSLSKAAYSLQSQTSLLQHQPETPRVTLVGGILMPSQEEVVHLLKAVL